MKNFLYLFLGFFFLMNFSHAQNGTGEVGKPIVIKPSYFDISPPFRDLAKNPILKADNSWKDGVVKNHSYPKDQHPVYYPDAIKSDPNVQYAFGSVLTDTTVENFDGIGVNGGVCPPDPAGDVGPNHYVQMVNLQYAVYNKTGTKLLGPMNSNNIWSGMPYNSNDGDGIVLYDEQADRWLISQFSIPNYPNGPFYEMVAISTTADPTGSWYRYQFSFPEMPDYPKLGVWRDGYYITVNRFTSSGNFLGPGVAAFDRTAMLAGNLTASVVYFPVSNSAYYHGLVADCDGTFPPAGTPEYVAWTSTNSMKIYEFHVDWTTPANSTLAQASSLSITPFTYFAYGVGLSQPGTGTKLDPLSYPGAIMNRLCFRYFSDHWSMVTNTTVNAGSNVAGIRWYEFRRDATNPWSVYQQATYAPADGNSRWCGSIAMDENGNIALAYSITSSSLYPSIRYAGRLANDPLNTLTIAEKGIINGGGSQTNTWSGSPSRWGDYSALTVDPSNASTFWYTTEYYSSTSSANWKTRIAAFSFANYFAVNATATPDVVCSGQQTQLDAGATGGSGTYTYSWSSVPAGFTSTQATPTANPTIDTRYVCAVNDGSATKTDTILVSVNQQPTSNAGPDVTYPNTTPLFPVSGAATYYSGVKWLTSGDGHFNIDTVLNSLYYTGPIDRNNGGVDLTMKAFPVGTCTDTATDVVHITLTFPAGIGNDPVSVFGVTISPNPASGNFNLVIHGGMDSDAMITVSDLTGKMMYRDKVSASSREQSKLIDISTFPKGIYMVKVQTGQQSSTKKLVIQ
ncbi:MAG: T9SS type A sorting domain-containing protein [Bacteroidetes bacterium]|nr:T9SS type A sorting domain-containing protein [Bacteroidota bacterium]